MYESALSLFVCRFFFSRMHPGGYVFSGICSGLRAFGPSGQVASPDVVRSPGNEPQRSLGLELLWLRPTSTKLLYGVFDPYRTGNIRGTLAGLEHGKAPGIRLVGRSGMGTGSAGLEFALTHFKSTKDQSADRGNNVLWGLLLHPNATIDDDDVTSIKLSTGFDFNEGSIGSRASFGFGSNGNISLSGGLQYTRLKQSFDITYIQVVSSGLSRTVYYARENTLSGFGPAFTLGTRWSMGGVAIFGELGAAMLVCNIGGHVSERDFQVSATTGTVRVDVEAPYGTRIVPEVSMKLGLGGNYQSNWGLFNVCCGYEVHNYFNAISTYEFYDDVDSQLGANDQSDIGIDGYFLSIQAQWRFSGI